MKDREAIRMALCCAILWEEGLIDSYRNVTGDDAVKTREIGTARINAWRSLLRRRYGGLAADPFADATRAYRPSYAPPSKPEVTG